MKAALLEKIKSERNKQAESSEFRHHRCSVATILRCSRLGLSARAADCQQRESRKGEQGDDTEDDGQC
jgi:hypothetical protein